MQVTSTNDKVTHAIVGGVKSIEMGVSTDSNFFKLLSTSIYSNPMLAMVRETVCNAWDSHIAAGKTDEPIIITLDEDYLTISDSGKAIHKDDIGPIYGVYGNSTKKSDQKQTGGFGIGCKSPFSYVDSFQVTSCHEGTKTIYRMNSSDSEINGTPTITEILSVPTNVTGIEVKIAVKKNDIGGLEHYIEQVVNYGGILAKLNNELVNCIPLGKETGDFLINFDKSYLAQKSTIFVRYGNVVYPVDSRASYENKFNRIVKILRALSSSHYRPPVTSIIIDMGEVPLAVAPSRETLSYQELTEKNIGKVLDLVFNKLNNTIEIVGKKTVIDKYHEQLKYNKLVAYQYPQGISGFINTSHQSINNLDDFVVQYVTNNFPLNKTDSLNLLIDLLDKAQNHSINPSRLSNYLNASRTKIKKGYLDLEKFSSGLLCNVIVPTYHRIAKKVGIPLENLYVMDDSALLRVRSSKYYYKPSVEPVSDKLVPFKKILLETKGDTLNPANMILNVLFGKCVADTNKNRGIKSGTGVFLHIPLKREVCEKVLAKLKEIPKIKLTVSYEPPEEKESKPKKEKVKKLLGYPSALNFEDKETRYKASKIFDEWNTFTSRVEKPKWVIQINAVMVNAYHLNLGFGTNYLALDWFLKNFGHEGALVRNKVSYDKLITEGVANAKDYYLEKLYAYASLKPEIIENIKFNNSVERYVQNLRGSEQKDNILCALISSFGIQKHLPDAPKELEGESLILSELILDRLHITPFSSVEESLHLSPYRGFVQLNELGKLHHQIGKHPYLNLIDVSRLARLEKDSLDLKTFLDSL